MYKRNSFNHRLLAAKVETCFLFCLVIAMSKPIPSFSPLRPFFPTVVGSSPPVHPLLLLLPSSPYYTPGTSPLPSNKYDRFFSPLSLLFKGGCVQSPAAQKRGNEEGRVCLPCSLSLSLLLDNHLCCLKILYISLFTQE